MICLKLLIMSSLVTFSLIFVLLPQPSFCATYYQFTNATFKFVHDDDTNKDQFYNINNENSVDDSYSSVGNAYDEDGGNRRRGGAGYPDQEIMDAGVQGGSAGSGTPWNNNLPGFGGIGDTVKATYTRDFGTYIGRLRPQAHGIAGLVYVVDERHLFVRNFRYDGTGPDAYFWVGDDLRPSPKGRVVPFPPMETSYDDDGPGRMRGQHDRNRGRPEQKDPPSLKKMRNENVLLTLPGELKVSDIRWLAIWCRRFTVDYGHVHIPIDVEIPTKVVLDSFPDLLGKLSSGRISILDSESFYVPNLHLLITEPGYHFWVGNSTNGEPNQNGLVVANEKARFDDLKMYSAEDIIITLPKGTTLFDINYLSVYSEQAKHNLGHITFDVRKEKIPPALGQTKKPGWWFDIPTQRPPVTEPPKSNSNRGGSDEFVPFNHTLNLPNCRELLGRKIRLLWVQEQGHVYFRVQVHMEPTQFAAVGIAAQGSPVIEADFVKVYFNTTSNTFQTEDAFLAKKFMCDFNVGLCPDTKHNSYDQVTFMGSMKNHGLSIVDFRRSILPTDKHDAPIPLEGPTQVIVAIGTLQHPSSYPNYNTLNLEKENVTIDFSSQGNYCPDTTAAKPETPPEDEDVWKRNIIRDKYLLVAHLGPTGGTRGYGAITGEPPSEKSVCWWINGLLMPEIYVERGKTYAFRVQGGDGIQHQDSFHPLYVTSHKEGGYGNKNAYEREREVIYAGVDALNGPGEPTPTGIGPLCEFVPKSGADKAAESSTFEKYATTLNLACEPGREKEYGWVNWTVSQDTPDLVYYQSYLDYGLGWKIHVLNEGEEPSNGQSILEITRSLLVLGSVLFAMV